VKSRNIVYRLFCRLRGLFMELLQLYGDQSYIRIKIPKNEGDKKY